MKKITRAIALSGGGPPVGLQVGALKALNERGIHFDVFTTDCIGSWTACIYNSHSEDKRIEKLVDFYMTCFVPDDIFSGFSVPINIFVSDYYRDSLFWIEKWLDYRTYEDLLLPNRIFEYILHYSNPWNFPKNSIDVSLMWTRSLSLNPYARLIFKLIYHNKKTGKSSLLGPGNYGKDLVDAYIDFDKLMHLATKIYVNAYNLTRQKIDLFINRQGHVKYKPIDLNVLKANSSILGYLENREIRGDTYCEGAVVDTVNFRDLLGNHPDLDEVWVINILDYKEIIPPKNQLEADLLAVELPFTTISQDDIKLFRYHLKKLGLDSKIKLVEIKTSYKDLDFFWKQSTLQKGIKIGYNGAMKTIQEYLMKNAHKQKEEPLPLAV